MNFAETILAEINSPDYTEKCKKVVRGWAVESKYNQRHTQKLRNRIKEMSDPEFLSFVSMVCEREVHRNHPTYLFTTLLNVICDPAYNRPVNNKELVELYIYKGISFRIYFDKSNGYRYKISMRKRVFFESK